MAKCRIAAGTVYIKDLSAANQPYLSVGNAQASLAISEQVQDLPDYESVAGGNACSVRDVDSVELTLTMYDYDKKNLALAVFGTPSAPAGASITDEPVKMFADGITPLAHMPTNTGTLTNGATTYVVNTDYTVSAGGLKTVAGSALETAINGSGTGTPKYLACLFDYTYATEDVVEALVTSGKTFSLLIHCKNKAASSKNEVWHLYTVQFGPTAGLPIISREFGQFEVKGELLSDATQAVGTSKFFKIQQEI